MRFADRREAGRQLAAELLDLEGHADAMVLALPRGGVPVAYEIARRLELPLDVLLVRKLGAPGREELAVGAIASGGIQVLNEEAVTALGLGAAELEAIARRERLELERREQAFRGGRPPLVVRGKRVIVVDDGLATGSTMRAAVMALRQRQPAQVVVAVPVGSVSACSDLSRLADRVVCLLQPPHLWAISHWFDDFRQTTDAEVRQLLRAAPASPSRDAAMT